MIDKITISLVTRIILVEPRLCHHACEPDSQSSRKIFQLLRVIPPFHKHDEKDTKFNLSRQKKNYHIHADTQDQIIRVR